jgi:hypothetical protein
LLASLTNRAESTYKSGIAVQTSGATSPLVGSAIRIEGAKAVLVDPISEGICQAQAMVKISPKGAHAGSYKRSMAKATVGLLAALSRWIARP